MSERGSVIEFTWHLATRMGRTGRSGGDSHHMNQADEQQRRKGGTRAAIAAPRVVVLKCGDTAPSVRVALGDYDRWFAEALGGQARPHVVEAHLRSPLPDPRRFDAVIATGSPSSVIEAAPWMRRASEWLLGAAERRVPVLGVCFGHQLLAAAFGAQIRRSPRGREIGTIACALTEAGARDPLFEGVPGVFEVQATHEDEVSDPPASLEALASNDHGAWQAFRAGSCVRAVQFHPEMSAAAIAALIRARAATLEADAAERGGEAPGGLVRGLLAGIRQTPWGRRILRNFVERFA